GLVRAADSPFPCKRDLPGAESVKSGLHNPASRASWARSRCARCAGTWTLWWAGTISTSCENIANAVRATWRVSYHAYAPTPSAPTSGTIRASELPSARSESLTPTRCAMLRKLCAVAHGLRGCVTKQAIHHLLAREGGMLTADGGDIGDHLRLDFPDRHQFRQHRQPA